MLQNAVAKQHHPGRMWLKTMQYGVALRKQDKIIINGKQKTFGLEYEIINSPRSLNECSEGCQLKIR